MLHCLSTQASTTQLIIRIESLLFRFIFQNFNILSLFGYALHLTLLGKCPSKFYWTSVQKLHPSMQVCISNHIFNFHFFLFCTSLLSIPPPFKKRCAISCLDQRPRVIMIDLMDRDNEKNVMDSELKLPTQNKKNKNCSKFIKKLKLDRS